MKRTDYREAFANNVTDLELLAMGKPLVRQQVAELITEAQGDDDAYDVTEDLWADAMNATADAIYSEVFGHLDDRHFRTAKTAEIVAWLDDGEPLNGATVEGLAANWREFDAEDVARNA